MQELDNNIYIYKYIKKCQFKSSTKQKQEEFK